ncbi:phage tail protein [Pedobacter sp. GSP4]|uniref:phage tail protein n=1 Tax=Pedobacter sp. GSP4 TaxID=3453716 RepID=UPI003EEAFFE1
MDNNFVGEIKLVAENYAPSGWAFCRGQLLQIRQYTALFSLLGTNYGGDGKTTFGLPNLQGIVPVGMGSGPGLTPRVIGEEFGAESVTLSANNLPMHTHAVRAVSANGTVSEPTGNYFANKGRGDNDYTPTAPNVAMNPMTVGIAGSSLPVPLMQPYLALNYVIALQGVFPARN